MMLPSEGLETPLEFSYNSYIARAVVTTKAISRALLHNSTKSSGHVVLGVMPLQDKFILIVLTGELHSMSSRAVLPSLLHGPDMKLPGKAHT